MQNYIESQIQMSINVKEALLQDKKVVALIAEVCRVISSAYKKGNKVLIAGNGGSAADAQHIAGELVSRFYFDRPGLPAMALTTDTSILTAIGNDYGYDKLFARQIQANGLPGDVFIGISTSGKSANILAAVLESRSKGIVSVGITGYDGGFLAGMCDYCITVPSTETPRIQEAHILVGHIICAVVELEMFGRGF